MNRRNGILKCAVLCAGLLLTAGCAETRTEREFGDAVRSVMNKQIYDHGAASMPSTEAVTGGHTGRLEGVVDAHGSDVASNDDISRPVSVEVGSSR